MILKPHGTEAGPRPYRRDYPLILQMRAVPHKNLPA